MAILNGCEIPDDLYYYLEGSQMTWIRLEGENATLGLTDPAQTRAGRILHVRIKAVGTTRERGKPLATIESGKWAGPVHFPMGGTVMKANEQLEIRPVLINDDPYGEGWIAQIKITDQSELSGLLRGEQAQAKFNEIIARDNVKCIRCQK